MNRNIFKCKKVDICSCKICHSDFCLVNLARVEFRLPSAGWLHGLFMFFLKHVDCILNTRKLHINLYKSCLDPWRSVDNSKNYLAGPWRARTYICLVKGFLFSCVIMHIKKMSCSVSKWKKKVSTTRIYSVFANWD